MTTNLETLATALYVRIDDSLAGTPRWGRPPRLTDAELLTLAVMQALLGFASETRWLRFARRHLAAEFPYLPEQSGYNKRLRAANTLISRFIRTLARDTDLWHDDVWIVDSTPVECARSRPTVQRSDLAGWAGYGYCPSHSRFFWGLRLHLLCTPGGLPIAWALAHPKTDEREVLADMLTGDPDLLTTHPGQTVVGDKGYVSKHLDTFMAGHGLTLLRPSYRNLKARSGEHLLKPIRQLIESVNDTLKGQLDLERHGARTPAGVLARVGQRILALTAAIWHNRAHNTPLTRSLIAYDH
ncbi:IS982 family transposase [Streptomyces sp. NRRL F-2580]|uniref:IS982 family transposase n=1 Tax=Streptomyces sp. NRRL F-2580 TaxID=1463841 RepID=UPI0004CB0F1F|nr:IS982 family transposase [Streptomyces sp. NRRL F-2580]